jgi:hypothetical protein
MTAGAQWPIFSKLEKPRRRYIRLVLELRTGLTGADIPGTICDIVFVFPMLNSSFLILLPRTQDNTRNTYSNELIPDSNQK